MGNIFKSTLNTRPILEDSLKYIRSDIPTEVTESEREWLLNNNVSVVVDLRTDEERIKKECPLVNDEKFSYYCMPVTGGNAVPESVDDVSKSYIKMVDDNLKHTIDFISGIDSNVLYFCNAGKDRTGVLSAILLLKAGATEEYIIEDYMKSKNNLKDMLESFVKNNSEFDINVITPQERYIKEFLEWFAENND